MLKQQDSYKIRILFVRPKLWFLPLSLIIRLLEKTPYSHTAIHILPVDVVYHSHISGTTIIPFYKFLKQYKIIKYFEININSVMYYSILEYFMQQTHIPYSIKQLFGQLYAIVLNKRYEPNIFKDYDAGQICTEAVAYFLYRMFNVQFEEYKNGQFDNIGLQYLDNKLKTLPQFKEIIV